MTTPSNNSNKQTSISSVVEEEVIEEVNALASGNVVGYVGPLGMGGPDEDTFFPDGKKNKKAKTASPELHSESFGAMDPVDVETPNMIKGLWSDPKQDKKKSVKTDSEEVVTNNESISMKFKVSEQRKQKIQEAIKLVSSMLESRTSLITESTGKVSEKTQLSLKEDLMKKYHLLENLYLMEALSQMEDEEFWELGEAAQLLQKIPSRILQDYIRMEIPMEKVASMTAQAYSKEQSELSGLGSLEDFVMQTSAKISKLIMAMSDLGDMLESGALTPKKGFLGIGGNDPKKVVAKVLRQHGIVGLDPQLLGEDLVQMNDADKARTIQLINKAAAVKSKRLDAGIGRKLKQDSGAKSFWNFLRNNPLSGPGNSGLRSF